MARCVICGAEFPNAIVWTIPSKDNKTSKPYPKEICNKCATSNENSGVIRRYPDTDIMPYIDLAGEVMHLVMKEYVFLYERALESADALRIKCYGDMLTSDEKAFLSGHKQLVKSQFHAAATLGNLVGMLDSARRSVENKPKFRELLQSGYNIFERR